MPAPLFYAVELLPVARGCRPWLSPVAVARGCRVAPRKIFGIPFDFSNLHCMLTMLRETNNEARGNENDERNDFAGRAA